MVSAALLLALVLPVCTVAKGPPNKPTWPSKFFVNFQEFYSDGGGDNHEGGYALDANYVDNKTGIKGAQVIYRGITEDEACNAVNPGTSCVTLAVAGQRYLLFEDGTPTCCRCCSWKNGCGPLMPKWTENATYTGTKTVRGEICYSYSIPGVENNSLSVRASDGMICELENGGNVTDFFEFIPATFKDTIPADTFNVPASCDNWCGPHAECKLG